jgi:hypothetical protein
MRAPKMEAYVTIRVGYLVPRPTNSLEYAANRSTSRRRRDLIVCAQHGENSFAASANSVRAASAARVRHDISRMDAMWITPALAFK